MVGGRDVDEAEGAGVDGAGSSAAAREGLVIEQLRKLQEKVSAEAGAAAAEAQCASGDETPPTSDSEEEE